MESDLESRIERLEAELAHASSATFAATTFDIAMVIALGAVIVLLGPAARQKAARDARREAARQRSEGLTALQTFHRSDDKAWTDFIAQQDDVVRQLDRLFSVDR